MSDLLLHVNTYLESRESWITAFLSAVGFCVRACLFPLIDLRNNVLLGVYFKSNIFWISLKRHMGSTHLKSPKDRQSWRLTSVYPQKHISRTILSTIDSQVSLGLLSKTGITARLTDWSSASADSTPLLNPRLGSHLRSLFFSWVISQITAACGWWSRLETVSPMALLFTSVTLTESPFFFVQMKINLITSSTGDSSAHSAQWKHA